MLVSGDAGTGTRRWRRISDHLASADGNHKSEEPLTLPATTRCGVCINEEEVTPTIRADAEFKCTCSPGTLRGRAGKDGDEEVDKYLAEEGEIDMHLATPRQITPVQCDGIMRRSATNAPADPLGLRPPFEVDKSSLPDGARLIRALQHPAQKMDISILCRHPAKLYRLVIHIQPPTINNDIAAFGGLSSTGCPGKSRATALFAS